MPWRHAPISAAVRCGCLMSSAFAGLLLLTAPIAAEDRAKNAESGRPNIVVILADDLGYGDIGCYGGWIKTPHLDALAEAGVRFTDFHSSGTVCSPTRAGLMTGQYQQRVGIPGVVTAKGHRDKGLSPDHLTFAKLIQQAGYATAVFGKWHLGYQPKYNPVHHGFDRFRGYVSGNVDYFSHVDQAGHYDWWDGTRQIEEDGYVTHLITKHSVAFIDEHKNRPFCLYVAHEAPHSPYQGPGDRAERTVGGEFEIQGARADKKQAYREMVEELDKSVGDVIAALRRHNLERRTFVFFFSDNGANRFGSNGALRGFKGSVWEGGHRVPAIASWPGTIPAGKTTDELTISLDLFPTIAALAQTPVPDEHKLDGKNLLPLLKDDQSLGERTLFWRHAGQKAVRQGDWKLVVANERPRARTAAAPALFNLADDIAEEHDLADQEPDRRKRLQSLLDAWEQEIGPDEFGS
jgi:arylsulfatase A